MKIALVITELHPGGAEKCFVHLACHLHRNGHEVCVWQLFPETPPEKRLLVELLEQQRIPIQDCNVSRSWHFPSGVGKLKRELSSFAPDLVQSFLFHANLAAALASPAGIPLVGGARVTQPEWWRGFLQSWSAKKMERLVCVSESVRRHCETKERISAKKLLVIPNGIEQVHPATTGQNEELRKSVGVATQQPLILFAGRLAEQKGILPFIRQAEKFFKYNSDYNLVLLGDGEQRSAVEELIQKKDLATQTHTLGWQPNALEWMQAADCLVLPALYEGMPNVVLEAMSCGLPIVSFEVDGVRELLGEEAKQQMATPGNYEQLLEKLKNILDNKKLGAELGTANQRRASEHFALQKQLLKYEELYRSLVAEAKS
ncbi:MAG: glycosyltransferase [Planctomycetota bacterium]|nr:glycosyltransferase [Planctomycetota bacterium]